MYNKSKQLSYEGTKQDLPALHLDVPMESN